MAWNPEKYNEFKSVRYLPFFDIVQHIKDRPNMEVLDLGCGTGELTSMLADKLNTPNVLGIDSSPEMLSKANEYANENISFEKRTIEEVVDEGQKWDLIFSNAALQWSDNHEELFPKIISKINSGGQLAVQMPVQNENLLNQLVLQLVGEAPFSAALQGWKRISPVLSLDDYAQILFDNGGKNITLYQKVYPIIADSHDQLYDFISGSTLVPYFERLDGDIKDQFIRTFKDRIAERFPSIPAIYAFKRLLIYCSFEK